MNLRAIREVNNGFGDGLAAAFEMIATPFIFGFLGYLLDHKLGIGPWFQFGLGGFTFLYECWKVMGQYNAQMAKHEENAPWNRHKKAAAVEATASESAAEDLELTDNASGRAA